jgi:hypothetical protein
MAHLLPAFPPLPEHFDNGVWSHNVNEAHHILSEAYEHAINVFNANDNDVHRLRLHSDTLMNRMLPMLSALEPEVLNEEWIEACATTMAGLVVELEGYAASVEQV